MCGFINVSFETRIICIQHVVMITFHRLTRKICIQHVVMITFHRLTRIICIQHVVMMKFYRLTLYLLTGWNGGVVVNPDKRFECARSNVIRITRGCQLSRNKGLRNTYNNTNNFISTQDYKVKLCSVVLTGSNVIQLINKYSNGTRL